MTDGPCQYETVAWTDLTVADRAAWEEFRALRPTLSGPWFTLAWCDAVHAVRGDLEVVRLLRDGRCEGLLPFHRGRLGAIRPAGGPLSDVHGFICPPGAAIDAPALVAALGARSFRFTGAPADDPGLAPWAAPDPGFSLDLAEGYDAYRSRRSQLQPKAFRNLRARHRRLDDACVEVDFRPDDPDPQALAALIELKREQYRRTRQIDVFAPAWTRSLLQRLADLPCSEASDPRMRGRLSTLRLDGRLAAGHFGLQAEGVLHYWFTAYDPAFADYSPGLLLLHELARVLPAQGVNRIDLGGGGYRFKREFADLRPPLGSGVVHGRGLIAGAARGAEALAGGVGRLPLGRLSSLPARALRRLDRLIAFHEPATKSRPAA